MATVLSWPPCVCINMHGLEAISYADFCHYSDVIMGAMAPRITSHSIVYSTVYSGADQRKHQSSASLAFVWGTHRSPVNYPHKWPVTRKMFPFDDVIMLKKIRIIRLTHLCTSCAIRYFYCISSRCYVVVEEAIKEFEFEFQFINFRNCLWCCSRLVSVRDGLNTSSWPRIGSKYYNVPLRVSRFTSIIQPVTLADLGRLYEVSGTGTPVMGKPSSENPLWSYIYCPWSANCEIEKLNVRVLIFLIRLIFTCQDPKPTFSHQWTCWWPITWRC